MPSTAQDPSGTFFCRRSALFLCARCGGYSGPDVAERRRRARAPACTRCTLQTRIARSARAPGACRCITAFVTRSAYGAVAAVGSSRSAGRFQCTIQKVSSSSRRGGVGDLVALHFFTCRTDRGNASTATSGAAAQQRSHREKHHESRSHRFAHVDVRSRHGAGPSPRSLTLRSHGLRKGIGRTP